MTEHLLALGFKLDARRNFPCYYRPANPARTTWVYCFLDEWGPRWGIESEGPEADYCKANWGEGA
jgi:hypothetical protein